MCSVLQPWIGFAPAPLPTLCACLLTATTMRHGTLYFIRFYLTQCSAAFLGYAVCVILLSVYLIFVVAPKHGKRNIFVNLTICSVVGSLSVIGVKVSSDRQARKGQQGDGE